MKRAKALFVFDLDDTLIDNVHDYSRPILNSCELIIGALGSKAPHVSAIIALEQEIDKRRVREINPTTGKPYLYTMERFPGSLVETYRHLCKRATTDADGEIEQKLWAIGMQAFSAKLYKRNIKPETKTTLAYLHNQGFKLILCTKGDPRVQQKKIDALKRAGITEFSKIEIVDEKNEAIFVKMAEGFSGQLFSVGNSYESDIVPALASGYLGIYIPAETWETIGEIDELLKKVDKKSCVVLENLSQLKDFCEKTFR